MINVNISFQTFANGVLRVDYWNADSSSWVTFPDGQAPIQTAGNFSTCSGGDVSIYLDFSGFTSNQLQNFRYRFVVNDAGNQLTGVCMLSPSLFSFSSQPPSNVTISNITNSQVTVNWVGSGTNYKIEYGTSGFTLGTGMQQNTSSSPYTLFGLNQNTTYDVYVSTDCSSGNQSIYSSWNGPTTFNTSSLQAAEFYQSSITIFPNPTNSLLMINDTKTIKRIVLYSLEGQQLLDQDCDATNIKIDMSMYRPGLYFATIYNENGSETKKIIKE